MLKWKFCSFCCCWTEMIMNEMRQMHSLCTHGSYMCKESKIGSDYKECCNVDQWLCIDPGHIWKCFIIDSGSALHHFVYPTVENTGADSLHTLQQLSPLIYQLFTYTLFFPNHICALALNENNLSLFGWKILQENNTLPPFHASD